jgi:hypothetical protein
MGAYESVVTSERSSKRSGTSRSTPPEGQSLRVPEALERLAELEVLRAKLLGKIEKVKASLARLMATIEEAATNVATTMLPLLLEVDALKAELHGLFRELLVKRRLPRASAEVVADVYDMLIETGLLEPPDEFDAEQVDHPGEPDPRSSDADADADFDASDEAESAGAGAGAAGSSFRDRYGMPEEHPSESKTAPRDPALADALRAVFRRLARALHPDGVQDPAEQAQRTEAMKEITQAHRMHDLARLLELERRWLASGTLVSGQTFQGRATDETAQRCQELSDVNDLLLGQIRDLERELRRLRRSEPAQMLSSFKRGDRERGMPAGSTAASLVAEGTAERDRYIAVRNLVRDYRDGKATLAQLRKGPPVRMRDARRPSIRFEVESPEEFQQMLDHLDRVCSGTSGSANTGRSARSKKPAPAAKPRGANRR